MECKHPLSDNQISAALDGMRDEETRRHLEDCPRCRAKLAEAQRMETSLMKKLFRLDCLPPAMLRDHALALLTDAQSARVTTHLEDCALCRAELKEIQVFLAPDELDVPEAPPTATVGTLAQIFSRLGDLLLQPVVSPVATALRGDTPDTLRFESDGLTVFVELDAKPGYFGIMGQLIAADQQRWIGALVECRQENTVVVTTFVGEAGIFNCEVPDLRPVSLRLIPETGQPVFIEHIQPDR